MLESFSWRLRVDEVLRWIHILTRSRPVDFFLIHGIRVLIFRSRAACLALAPPSHTQAHQKSVFCREIWTTIHEDRSTEKCQAWNCWKTRHIGHGSKQQRPTNYIQSSTSWQWLSLGSRWTLQRSFRRLMATWQTFFFAWLEATFGVCFLWFKILFLSVFLSKVERPFWTLWTRERTFDPKRPWESLRNDWVAEDRRTRWCCQKGLDATQRRVT